MTNICICGGEPPRFELVARVIAAALVLVYVCMAVHP